MIKGKGVFMAYVREIGSIDDLMRINSWNFAAWDFIHDCTQEACVAFNNCTVAKSGRCGVAENYMRSVFNVILRGCKAMDEISLLRVGMGLVPLYKVLIKMKIEEIGIGRVVFKGRVHPLYKEMRDTIKAIEFVWNNLLGDKSESNRSKNRSEDEENLLNGDPKAYMEMVARHKR